jgi:hypothetical protein
MPSSPSARDRLLTTATWGVWLTTLVLALLVGVIVYFLWTSLSDSDALSRLLMEQLELLGPAPLLGTGQAVTLTVMWLLTDVIGLLMLLQTRALFAGIKRRGAFTDQTGVRLRTVGWLVFALGPVSVVINAGCAMLMNYWRDPTGLSTDISISDGDLYAMVIGLVIVAVGHIMVDATRLDAENRSFI